MSTGAEFAIARKRFSQQPHFPFQCVGCERPQFHIGREGVDESPERLPVGVREARPGRMVREDEQPEWQPVATANRRGDEESQSSCVALGQPLRGIRRNQGVFEGAVQGKALDDAPPFHANANAGRHPFGMVEHGKKRDWRSEDKLG